MAGLNFAHESANEFNSSSQSNKYCCHTLIVDCEICRLFVSTIAILRSLIVGDGASKVSQLINAKNYYADIISVTTPPQFVLIFYYEAYTICTDILLLDHTIVFPMYCYVSLTVLDFYYDLRPLHPDTLV